MKHLPDQVWMLCVACIPFALFLACSRPSISSEPRKALFLASHNGKAGFIDASGRVIIPLQFTWAGPFSEGLAIVGISGLYGAIDESGQLVIPARFGEMSPFRGGLSVVKDRTEGKKPKDAYYVIDRTGRRLTDRRYEYIGSFTEGLAPVKIEQRYGYVDVRGRLAIEPAFDMAEEFSEGVAAVGFGAREMIWGYVSHTGKLVIKPQFTYAGRFSEGLASVKLGEKLGYINHAGSLAIPATFTDASVFSEGLAMVGVGELTELDTLDKGYIDTTGKFVIRPQFGSPFWLGFGAFKRGLAVACIQNCDTGLPSKDEARYGYVDRRGQFVIAPQFSAAWPFIGELARACRDKHCGWIDRTGSFVWID